MSPHNEALAALSVRMEYAFHQPALLIEALTHASFLQENPAAPSNNQRLEFLGDSVLQLILTEELYRLYPMEREGVLSRRRAALTRGDFLSRQARELGLDAALRLSQSEEQTGGRVRASALEDAFEALVGAIYLDSDFPMVRRVVLGWYGPLPTHLNALEDAENPKGRLQELIQPRHGNTALRYEVTRIEGQPHERVFEVQVFLLERKLGTGCGRSKKLAEEAAAREALVGWLPEERD